LAPYKARKKKKHKETLVHFADSLMTNLSQDIFSRPKSILGLLYHLLQKWDD
jgi:hypothetical protein